MGAGRNCSRGRMGFQIQEQTQCSSPLLSTACLKMGIIVQIDRESGWGLKARIVRLSTNKYASWKHLHRNRGLWQVVSEKTGGKWCFCAALCKNVGTLYSQKCGKDKSISCFL